MKPVIVGMCHPSSRDPVDALELRTANAAGERLWKMALSVRPISKSRFDATFLKINLSATEEFPPPEERIAEVRLFLARRRAVVLGKQTWHCLTGLIKSDWFGEANYGWHLVPHPSGRCLVYNDEAMRRKTGELLVKLGGWQ
jgi:hypothetical protein